MLAAPFQQILAVAILKLGLGDGPLRFLKPPESSKTSPPQFDQNDRRREI
jgi:hypothetical protein